MRVVALVIRLPTKLEAPEAISEVRTRENTDRLEVDEDAVHRGAIELERAHGDEHLAVTHRLLAANELGDDRSSRTCAPQPPAVQEPGGSLAVLVTDHGLLALLRMLERGHRLRE